VSAPRLALVGGGVRSGKSSFAVKWAMKMGERRAFVATARAGDEEMTRRIARHREDRAGAFVTVEEPLDLERALAIQEETDVVVVDCLSHWLTNCILAEWTDAQILASVDRLLALIARQSSATILVTNEVGMSLHAETPLGRRFQDLAGWTHQRVSAAADEVYLAVMGLILRIKPQPLEVSP
jgi:adenosylcobinamide kinase/adenosylcobinamide-phosphate guanylyltransferase